MPPFAEEKTMKNALAFGINDAGEIVGEYVDSAGRTHGFIGTFQ